MSCCSKSALKPVWTATYLNPSIRLLFRKLSLEWVHTRENPLPSTLREASELLRASEMARAEFGDRFVDHYATTRDWEDHENRKAVTDWELARYFEII